MTKLERRVQDLRQRCQVADERATLAREGRIIRTKQECDEATELRMQLTLVERELKGGHVGD